MADMFVFPTLNETFGLVLLEAMEYGIPCIATDEGGIKDIVDDKHTGLVINRNDATGLAQAIEKLIIDAPLRKQMSLACRLKFEERYTESVFERNMLNCLNNAL